MKDFGSLDIRPVIINRIIFKREKENRQQGIDEDKGDEGYVGKFYLAQCIQLPATGNRGITTNENRPTNCKYLDFNNILSCACQAINSIGDAGFRWGMAGCRPDRR
jgi:hypothetical protein